MGSESTMKLPVIDFSNLKQETETWESVKTQVSKALAEYGCFEAIFSNRKYSLVNVLQQLFDLPLQTKLLNKSDTTYHGYIGQHAIVPLYESLGISDALVPGNIEAFTELMWSDNGNPTFCESVRSISEELLELNKIVRTMVLENNGIKKYLDEHIDSTNYVVRFQKYDGPKTNETELGLVPHIDMNTLTILFQDDVTGLEMQKKDGDDWIETSPNSFIVMAGESLRAWTNGRVHAPFHRVMMTGDKARYSIGLFAVPKSGYIVTAPKEMVDEEHPLFYKPYDYVEFLNFYYGEASKTSPNALKDYCGVV
ncbi:hypothetical protein ABFS83_09G093100 [Erythranthe nasuta]